MKRVVITGAGAVTPLGLTAPATWTAMVEGRCAIGELTDVPREGLRSTIAAQVRGFDPAAHFDPRQLGLLDRVSQFTLVAAREAVAQAGLARADFEAARGAAIVGTGIGGQTTHDEQFRRLYAEGAGRVHPLTIVRLIANAPASHLTMTWGIRGPAFAVSSACASANHALALAAGMVRRGEVDLAIAGGSEACITYGTLKAWEAMRVLADDTCRPFSADRRGLVLAEGAGIFVLESLERARARGATPLVELAGCGMSADASDLVLPTSDGARRAMTEALEDAGLAPQAIGYINAHGTGTPANDPTETEAIRLTFGAYAERLAVSSTKSGHGHALGAAGAIELIALIGALREGRVPPTLNFRTRDPACNLDYVVDGARSMPDLAAGLSNSFAFGGLNAVLALRRLRD